MWLNLLLDVVDMVFKGSGEFQLGIEEACNSCTIFCEDMDDCWQTEYIWVGYITESFIGRGTVIIGDDNSLIFELLSFLLKHRLSPWLLCKDLDDSWLTKDSLGELMTELFNGGETDITGDDISLIFEWLPLRVDHWLSWGVVCYLTWFFPVPLLWQRPISFGRGMMNTIWVCGGVVCHLFCLLMSIKRWEPTFWCNNCSHVWVSVPAITLVAIFLSQYHPD